MKPNLKPFYLQLFNFTPIREIYVTFKCINNRNRNRNRNLKTSKALLKS